MRCCSAGGMARGAVGSVKCLRSNTGASFRGVVAQVVSTGIKYRVLGLLSTNYWIGLQPQDNSEGGVLAMSETGRCADGVKVYRCCFFNPARRSPVRCISVYY
jgi:hypothetical protein